MFRKLWKPRNTKYGRSIERNNPPFQGELTLTLHQCQKHFYRWVRLCQRGYVVRIIRSKRQRETMIGMVPYEWSGGTLGEIGNASGELPDSSPEPNGK